MKKLSPLSCSEPTQASPLEARSRKTCKHGGGGFCALGIDASRSCTELFTFCFYQSPSKRVHFTLTRIVFTSIFKSTYNHSARKDRILMEIKYAVKIIDKTELFTLDEAGSNMVKEEKKPRYNKYAT